jgi:hypothetical protein
VHFVCEGPVMRYPGGYFHGTFDRTLAKLDGAERIAV